MKPHQLQIEAFGPYALPVAIDFDALSQEGLFLIHGRTGAGKTFLLDALCFALYGEVSGDRNVKGLRSDHAPSDAVPRVCLSFSCDGRRYRIERSPHHSAPRQRGSGTIERPAKAVLARLESGQATPISNRPTEVTREIEHLVGLNAAQFRQVILLPQGRFAAVLRARAEEREALLQTLFDTVTFEQAGQWLDDRARKARQDLADQGRHLEQLQRQAAQTWMPFATPAAGENGSDLRPEPPDPGDPEGIAPLSLPQLQERIAAVVAQTSQQLRQASDSLAALQRDRATVDRQAERWDRRAGARVTLAELETKLPLVEEYRQRLHRAEQAEALRASVEAEQTARQELQQQQERLSGQLRRAHRARDAALSLPPELVLFDPTTAPSMETLVRAQNALASRRSEVTALNRKAVEAVQAEAAAEQANRSAAAASALVAQADADLKAREKRLQQATEAWRQACSARDQLDGLRRAAQAAAERAEACDQLTAAQGRLQTVSAAQKRADDRCSTTQAALLELRKRQIAGMAARLSETLTDGDPCPVCGSLQHPSPARPGDDAIDEAAINAAERDLHAASAAARVLAADRATVETELRLLHEKAGTAADDPASAQLAARQTREALQAASTLAAETDRLQQEIQGHGRELQALQRDLQTADKDQTLQTRIAADAAALAERLRTEIAAELGEGLTPLAVLESFTDLEAALRDLGQGSQSCAAALTRLEQAAARLVRELAASDFADAEAVRAALKEDNWRRELAERIASVERRLIEVRAVLASPDLADLPEQRPDTEAAESAVMTADAARTAAVERHSEARTAGREIDRLAAEHLRLEDDVVVLRQQAGLLSAVADRAQGRTAPFVSLQRWVLSAYLEEICRYANQRLELMTSGRYQLRLSDEGGRGGRKAGLDLRVLDAYTGEEREVSSLSGGETFQASLALALGVAETVEGHAGGLRLDALFIDEGFGSLDPDTLQLAMDELDRLRVGGRMIGLISHVGSLRERIRQGIEVISGERGSSLRIGLLEEA